MKKEISYLIVFTILLLALVYYALEQNNVAGLRIFDKAVPICFLILIYIISVEFKKKHK